MHKVSQVIRYRRHRYTRDARTSWMKLGLLAAFFTSLAAVVVALVGVGYAVNLTRDLPSKQILPSLLDSPDGLMLHPSRLLDRSGEHVLSTLENPGATRKQAIYVPPDGVPGVDQVPAYLVNATILELDPDFWSNPGFKFGGVIGGTHPTLAQVLVTNLLLTDEAPSVLRNLRERILAAQITSEYGRQRVMQWYLNSAQYGDNLFGADAASRVYFGKPAAKLSFAEAAMLTAIAEKPMLSAWSGSPVIKQQQELIIQKMLVKGLVTGSEAQQALNEEIHFQPQVDIPAVAPDFSRLVLAQVSSIIPLERLYRGGYEIITTLDYSLQAQAECATNTQLDRIQGLPSSMITLDGSTCEASSFLPPNSEDVPHPAGSQDAEVVVIDPLTGQILSMVGGDGSIQALAYPRSHPAGTSLTPFLYLTAFTRGMSPATLLWDIPPASSSNTQANDETSTTGEDVISYHGAVSLRQALVNDYLGSAREILKQVGGTNVSLTQASLGITDSLLGSSSEFSLEDFFGQNVSLLDNVYAYSVLANQGSMAGEPVISNQVRPQAENLRPTSILTVRDINGREWLDWRNPKVIPVTSPQLAYLVTDVLSDGDTRSSSYSVSMDIERPAAYKVSLNKTGSDAWTIGYTTHLVVGVWLGSSPGNEGGSLADTSAGLWQAITSYASSRLLVQDFSIPEGIKFVQVCEPSGKLPSPICPSIVQEVFLEGNEPTQVDDLYQKYSIDHETGLLATIFTPSDLVEEKVFLSLPSKVRDWAKSAGLAVPPDTYDSISLPSTTSQDAIITSPLMFNHVGGRVTFTGRAGGDGFSYYRLEVGKGLNPQEWLQIGTDLSTPVNNGILGTWDTSGLEGLYVVKLLVVKEDKRFDEAILQVTVDNTPPSFKISSPIDGYTYSFHPGKTIVINVTASDNLVLEQVEFYIDGDPVSIALDPPYIMVWESQVGSHTLLVKANDLAGNQSEKKISFVVK